MHAIRALGFVHRDISSKNVLIVRNEHGDWGTGSLIDYEYLHRWTVKVLQRWAVAR